MSQGAKAGWSLVCREKAHVAGGKEGMRPEKRTEPYVIWSLGHEKEPAFYSSCCGKAWEGFGFVLLFLKFLWRYHLHKVKCTRLQYKV